MTHKKPILISISIVLMVIILQTTSRGSQPVFAGSYPYLGREKPVAVPDCTPGPDTVVVSTNAELSAAMANTANDVFCLNPGNYTEIRLETPGTGRNSKWLIPYHETGVALPKPWDQPVNERVIIDNIILKSNFWFVVGVNVASDLPQNVEFRNGAKGNVLDSVLVEGISESLPTISKSRSMVRIGETTFYTHIQNSIFRNPPRIPYYDSHCLLIRDSRFNTVINNEFYDCPGDGIQIDTLSTPDWDNRGTKIVDNEIYLTERLYAVCSDPSIDANLNGPGECACAENGIDIKHNSSVLTGDGPPKMEIRGNVLYGFRQTHQACGGTADDTGPAIYLHNIGTQDILIQSNVIAFSDTGIQLVNGITGDPSYNSIFNNLLYNIDKKRALHIGAGTNNRFTHNTIVLTTDDGNVVGRHSIALTGSASSAIVSNNLVISSFNNGYRGFSDVPDPSGFIVKNNGYVQFATPIAELAGINDMVFPTDPLSRYKAHCFFSQKFSNPMATCYDYLTPRPNAASVDVITNGTFGLTYDFSTRPRELPYDLGAKEIQPVNFVETFFDGLFTNLASDSTAP